MNFWQKIKALVPIKHILFVLALFAVTMLIFYFDTAEDVKITFAETQVEVKHDRKYSMAIPYDIIEAAQLVELPQGGEKQAGGDNMVVRYGTWVNDTWGQYCICVDLDATLCIEISLNDGRTFVISRKSNEETTAVFEQLQARLAAQGG